MKLGKLPARPNSVTFKLSKYLSSYSFPSKYNHTALETAPWQMLGNDQYGDCVLAGAAHETMLWAAEGKKDVLVSTDTVLGDYSAITGFNPTDPSTDKGTDMQVAASYRQKVGIMDTSNVRHKVSAYLAISIGNKDEFKAAMSHFGVVGLGVQLPTSALTQFEADKNWTVEKRSKIAGGHYVPLVGYDVQHVYLVTWGRLIKASWEFVLKFADEAVVYLSEEMLTGGVSIDGFNLDQLKLDLNALK